MLASSRVSKLQVWDWMQIWKNMFLQTCSDWAQQEVKERWCERISCIIEGVYTIGLCILRFLSEKVYSTWRRKIGIKTRRQILQGHLAPIKVRERKGPSRGMIPKCEPHERSFCAPKFGERSHEETLHQERCALRVAWDLAKHIYKLRNADKATFFKLLLKLWTVHPQIQHVQSCAAWSHFVTRTRVAQEPEGSGLHIFVSTEQLSSTCHVSFLAAPDTDHKHKFSLTHLIYLSYLSDSLTYIHKIYDSRLKKTLRCSTA